MISKTKIKILMALFVCIAASLIAGCGIGEQTVDEFLNGKDAKNQIVTYYANGGSFNSMGELVVKDMYYQPNSYILTDFENTANISVSRSNYVFDGWYYVALTEDGNPVYEDEANSIVALTDQKVDQYLIQENEHIYVGAKWVMDLHLDVILVCDGTATDANGVTYKSGDIIASKYYGTNGTLSLTDTSPWTATGHTFLQYYYDEACTELYDGETLKRPTDESADNEVIYAKYIEGNWTIVKTASQVTTMYNSSASEKSFYIFNDIDCTGTKLSLNPGACKFTVEGNGHTISGLSFALSSISGNESYALFGKISSSASIRNLTLKDITVTVSVKTGMPSIYLVCSDIDEQADCFDNVVIDGAEVSISYPSDVKIINIQQINGVFDSSNWLFGGVESGGATTDEAFLAKYDGITLNNVKLTVNNETVVE